MADSPASKQTQNCSEKLKTLQGLIASLQEQAKKLQSKKASKRKRPSVKLAAGQIPELITSTAYRTFPKGVKKSHRNENAQDKKESQIIISDNKSNVSEEIGALSSHEISYGSSNMLDHTGRNEHSYQASQLVQPKIKPDQEAKAKDLIGSSTDNSDARLSQLAKEVWNRRTKKLHKVTYPSVNSPYKIKKHGGIMMLDSKMQLLKTKNSDHRNNLYKLNKVKSDLVKKSSPESSISLIGVNYLDKHIYRKNIHSTADKYIKDKMHWSSGGITEQNKSVSTISCNKRNVKKPKDISDSIIVDKRGNEDDTLATPVLLTNSSERLSTLAKETWRKSILARSSYQRSLKKWTKFPRSKSQGPIKPKIFFSTYDGMIDKTTGNSFAENTSKSNVSYDDISTNLRLSYLARKIWKNRSKLSSGKGIVYGPSSRRSLRYPLKTFRTENTFNFYNPTSKLIWRSDNNRVDSFLNRRRRVVLKQSRFKLVRGNDAKRSNSNRGRIQRRTKKRKDLQVLFTNIQGKKFVTDSDGRRLIRLSVSYPSHERNLTEALQGNPYLPARRRSVISPMASRYKMVRRQSITHNASSKIVTANRMVKKSLFHLHQQTARKFVKKQYCMFYNRFGKCKNGDRCRYVHDPEKVAVCTRYLRGTCKDKHCLFSHKIDTRKMPTCMFFLNGACHRENCPYAHVKVSGTAEICKEFLKGYCPSGDKCLKRHMLECEEFLKRGICSEGDKCKLYHRKRQYKRRRSSSISGTKVPRPFTKKLKLRRNSDELVNMKDTTESNLKIKPSFTSTEKPEWGVAGVKTLKRKRRFDWKKQTDHE